MQKATGGASHSRRKGSSKRAKAGSQPRADREANQALVEVAWLEIFKDTKRRPTNGAIAEKTGLSLAAVQRYTSGKGFNPLPYIRNSTMKASAMLVAERLLEKILLGELDGFGASDVRMFFEIVTGYRANDPNSAPKPNGPVVTIVYPDNGRTPGQPVTDPDDMDIDDFPDDDELDAADGGSD